MRGISTTSQSGLPDGAIKIRFNDSDNLLYLLSFSNRSTIPSYDSQVCIKPPSLLCTQEAMRVRMVKKTVGMSAGYRQPEPCTVLDSGATSDLIGGLGWKIVRITSQRELLSGALDGMGTCVLSKVDGVTAVKDSKGKTVLLGMGNVPWDRRQTQVESV